jgi:phage shock protein PspC (stress-responsive transcriptional regulator)
MSDQDQPHDVLRHGHRRARRPPAMLPLYRSERPRILGVAGGVAEFIGANPATVRLLWLASLPLSGGLTGVAYLVMAALLKRRPS